MLLDLYKFGLAMFYLRQVEQSRDVASNKAILAANAA